MPEENKIYDLIIIGAGGAGLSASIYASRYKITHLVFAKVLGGTITTAHIVENFPGFTSVAGQDLAAHLVSHAKELGGLIKEEEISHAAKVDGIFELTTIGGSRYQAKTIILATGSQRKRLDIAGEKDFLGKGISYCSTCDAPFFRNKTVVVVGGGDSALTASLHLSEFAGKVYVIYRGSQLRAEPTWIESVSKNPKIEVIFNTNIIEILGTQVVQEIRLDVPYKDKPTLAVDGVFIEIGAVPGTVLADQLGVKLDEKGYVDLGQNNSTNVPGVFAAGDLTNGSSGLRQLVTASSEGAIAAAGVYGYLKQKAPAPSWG
ncbi:MAG: FAD-dependent oxidoreductase [Patescibacteria group bacterium]|nr:FAD-dependent oxidoreductase [Patescibacteria group bacterium]